MLTTLRSIRIFVTVIPFGRPSNTMWIHEDLGFRITSCFTSVNSTTCIETNHKRTYKFCTEQSDVAKCLYCINLYLRHLRHRATIGIQLRLYPYPVPSRPATQHTLPLPFIYTPVSKFASILTFLTVHHSIDLFHLPTLMHNSFIH